MRSCDYHIVGHNIGAEDSLANYLQSGKTDSADIQTIIDSGRGHFFKAWLRRMRITPENASWNPPTLKIPKERHFSNNSNISRGQLLETQKKELRAKLIYIRDNILEDHLPVNLFDFFDEANLTTHMLKRTLKRILGKDFSDLVNDDLRANFSARFTDQPMSGYIDRLKAATKVDTINIWGGTFSDVDDARGIWYQKEVVPSMIRKGYFLGLCWGQQIAVRTFAKKHNLDGFVLNGARKFGFYPTEILNAGPFKGMFINSDNVQRITAAHLHTDHVVFLDNNLQKLGDSIKRPGSTRNKTPVEKLKTIAWDPIMNRPCGFASGDEKIVVLSFHPEVCFANPKSSASAKHDREDVSHYIRGEIERIVDNYEVDPDKIEESGLWLPDKIYSDPGEALVTSVLNFFADKFIEDHQKRVKNHR